MFEVEDSTTEYYKNQPIPEYNFEPAYKGNVIILCDAFSASAAELFIAYSYMFENVYLIGTNTSGTIDFGTVIKKGFIRITGVLVILFCRLLFPLLKIKNYFGLLGG